MKKVNLEGQKFGRLTVLKKTKLRKRKNVLWLCECECGKQKLAITSDLTRGSIKSCGCLATEIRSKECKKRFLGKPKSEETKSKMSLAQTGNKKWLGKKHSEETKQKIGLALKGRKPSAESIKKMSETKKGQKWTLQRRLEWVKRTSGKNNNNWKGGITPERKAVRSTHKYRKWSEAVRKRDGKCQDCGATKNLHAHHIERFLIALDKQYDIDNGTTLCAKCHYKYHIGEGAYSNGKIHLEKR